MKFFNSMVFSFAKFVLPVGMIFLMSSCSEEKKESLPDLPPIELPKDVSGLYSGSMPCDNCSIKMIRLTLKEDSTANVVQTIVSDAMLVDTLNGVFVVTDSSVRIVLPIASGAADSVHWNFKRSKSGNLMYMNSAGEVYENKNGDRAELIRILNVPAQKAKDM